MTTPTDKQERTPQEIGRAIADKLSTGDNDSVRALAKEAFCPASDDEFDDMWNDGDFRRFCCLPVKLARESAAPSGGCDVCGAEPGRCMTSTICAQERETRRENARAAASSDINEHLKGDDPRLEPCGGTRGANTPQDSSGPHTAAAAQSSNECGEIAGYVEASALKDRPAHEGLRAQRHDPALSRGRVSFFLYSAHPHRPPAAALRPNVPGVRRRVRK
jgi:hypothetical protein